MKKGIMFGLVAIGSNLFNILFVCPKYFYDLSVSNTIIGLGIMVTTFSVAFFSVSKLLKINYSKIDISNLIIASTAVCLIFSLEKSGKISMNYSNLLYFIVILSSTLPIAIDDFEKKAALKRKL